MRTKNYQNLTIGFQDTVENVGMFFWGTVYIRLSLHLQLLLQSFNLKLRLLQHFCSWIFLLVTAQ